MAKNKKVSVPKMQDTPYTLQARSLSELGGNQMADLHNQINVFDEPTQQSLQARVDDMYRKSEMDYQRQYRQAANKMNQANYRRFGTLNATPAAYASNLQELQNQDHLAKMAQQKAQSYDQVVNNELQRRYNTFNMYKSLYGLGQIPYEMDMKNIDREYANQLAQASSKKNWGSVIGGALGAAAGSVIAPGVGTTVGMSLGSGVGSMF